MKYSISALLLAICVLIASVPASAHMDTDTKDSAVKYYAKSYESTDIAAFMDKVKTVFFNDEFKAEHPMAGMFEGIMTVAGYFAIDRYDVEYQVAHGMMTCNETVTLNADYPESFVSRYMAVPDGDWRFDQFLSDGDYVFLMAINGFKEKGNIFKDYMTQVGQIADEASGGQANVNLGPLAMLQLDSEMFAPLGDEMDIVIFDSPDITREPQGPEDFNAAVMIPVEDYKGAMDLIGMAGGMMGFDVKKPGFSTFGWSFYPVMGTSAAIGISHDWMVMVTNYKKFVELAKVAPRKVHSALPKGSTYLRIDVDRLYKEMGKPAIAMLKEKNPNSLEPQFAQLFDIEPGTDLGAITCFGSHHKFKARYTTTMDDDVFNLMMYAFGMVMDSIIAEKMGVNVDYDDAPDYPVMAPPTPEESGEGGRDDEVPLKDPGAGNVYF
jgi:hypothetical protein